MSIYLGYDVNRKKYDTLEFRILVNKYEYYKYHCKYLPDKFCSFGILDVYSNTLNSLKKHTVSSRAKTTFFIIAKIDSTVLGGGNRNFLDMKWQI